MLFFIRKRIPMIIVFTIAVSLLLFSPTKADSPADFSRPLTLKQCLEIAVKNSYQIASAEKNLKSAEFNLKNSWTGYLPNLNLTGSYRLNEMNDKLEWTNQHYSSGLGLTQTLYNNGRTFDNIRKSKLSLSSVENNYQLAKQNLYLSVVEKYYNLLRARQLVKLYEENLKRSQHQLNYAQAKFDLGMVPRADILKTQVEVANAELSLLEAQNQLEIARAELNNVLGIDLDIPIKVVEEFKVEEEAPEFNQCLQEALMNRPEIKSARNSLLLTKIDFKRAIRNRLPSLTLSGGYNLDVDEFSSLGRIQYSQPKTVDWNLSLSLGIPLFDGGTRNRAILDAKLTKTLTERNLLEEKKKITLNVKKAYFTLNTRQKQIEIAEKQLKSAEESYAAAEGRYREGVAPVTEVIETQVALLHSQLNRAESRYNYVFAKASLDKARGKLKIE